MKKFHIKSITAAVFVFLLPFMVVGQSFLLEDFPAHRTRLGIRFLRPDFNNGNGISTLSGLYDFSVSFPVGSKLNIVGSLPLATISFVGSGSELSAGNMYIGLQRILRSTRKTGTSASLGVYLPTMPVGKGTITAAGYYTNYYEFQKFLPHSLTVYGNLAYRRSTSKGLLFNLEIGPNILIPTEDDPSNPRDTELYLHYGLSAGIRVQQFVLKAEWAGIGILKKKVDDSGDRLTHSIAFGINWNRGLMRPGIFYKIYLNKEFRDLVSGVIGFKLQIVVR